MSAGVRLAVGCAWVLASSACGFVGLDGLTGGDVGRPSHDPYGGDDGPSGGNDGAMAAAGDAEQVAEASPDGGVAHDAGAIETGTWCAQLSPAPPFCADYDEGPLLGAFEMGAPVQVTPPTVDPGGSATLTTTNPSSPPASYAAATQVLGDASVQARFENPVTLTNANGALLRFDMRIDEDDANEGIVADVFFNQGSNQVYAQFVIRSTGGTIRWQGAKSQTTGSFTEPPVGAWTKDIELTSSVSTGAIELRIGGTLVASAMGTLPFSTADWASFYLGLHVFAGSKQVIFDDVVFSPTP